MPDQLTSSDSNQPTPGLGEPAILAPPMVGEDSSGDGGGKRLDFNAPSIKDVKQAADICSSTEANNKARAYRAYVIQQVYDGAAPNSFGAKLQAGKSWQNNFSTNWLSGIGQPLRMRLQNAVITSETLTHSTMPDTIANYEQKTMLLQQAQSNILRNWDDFSDFLSAISGDTSLQGYCYAVFLDPITPYPTFFKLEDCRVPEKSKMTASRLQYLCADWDYPVQDFMALFADEEAAKLNGYDVKNCEAAAHAATIDNENASAMTANKPRRFAEMVTEGGIGYSYAGGGQRVVKTWMFWNAEYDGKVTFWLIDRDKKTLLRRADKIYNSMAEVVQIFSFEGGNSAIHSSKGVGRVLINQALALEKNRNRMLDGLSMSDLMVIQASAAARQKLDISVNSPFVVIGEEAKISAEKFTASADGYIAIDRFLTSAAQQAAGVWINDIINPAQNKTDKTATEARIENARGQESAIMYISRFLDKWHGMVSTSQIRAFSDENLEYALNIYAQILANPRADRAALYRQHSLCPPEVLREIVCVLKKWPGGVNPDDLESVSAWHDEIAVWRESPATLRAHILDEKYDAGVQQLYAEQLQARNPGIDQSKLLAMRTRSLVGGQYAEQLVIPKADETVTAEATREQQGENADMLVLGEQIPVSPRDNWRVHGQVCVQTLNTLTANPPPDKTTYAQLVLQHLQAHLDMAMQAGDGGNEEWKQLHEFAAAYGKQFSEVMQIRMNAEAMAMAVKAHLGGTVPGLNGTPEGAPMASGAPMAPEASAPAEVLAPNTPRVGMIDAAPSSPAGVNEVSPATPLSTDAEANLGTA